MIYRYFSIVIALIVTLAGLQVPGFINLYENRADAHLIEVQANLSGFQAIADRHHDGSIAALIEHHRRSADATFREEADAIAAMLARRDRFQAQLQGLEGSIVQRVSHMLIDADPMLMQETADNYTWTVTLNDESLICGVAALIVGIAVIELLRMSLLTLFRRRPAST